MPNNEPTNQDILDVLQAFAGSVDDRFAKMDDRFTNIDNRFTKMDARFAKMDDRLGRIEATMVTKDYLDDKLADLRGDLVTLVRKEDYKLSAVVNELVKRDVFDTDTASRIMAMEPYAKS